MLGTAIPQRRYQSLGMGLLCQTEWKHLAMSWLLLARGHIRWGDRNQFTLPDSANDLLLGKSLYLSLYPQTRKCVILGKVSPRRTRKFIVIRKVCACDVVIEITISLLQKKGSLPLSHSFPLCFFTVVYHRFRFKSFNFKTREDWVASMKMHSVRDTSG